MFKFMHNLSGSNRSLTLDMPIAKATNIKKGQLVRISKGKIVTEAVIPYLGVANETHTGEHDTFNPRNNDKKISVNISTGSVYAVEPPNFMFAVNAANTTSATLPVSFSYASADIIGGYIVFLSKGAVSANTENIGAVREITAYNSTTKLMTLTEGGIIGAGDKYAYFPPTGFKKLEIDATTFSNVILADAAADFCVVSTDIEKSEIHVMLKTSQIG